MEIKTSTVNWFAAICNAYAKQEPFTLVDDAKLGIDPRLQSAIEMGIRGGLTRKEILATLLSMGIVGIGAAMIIAAVLDPEATSKLALLVGGGIGFMAAGGFTIIRLLTKETPTAISFGKHGFSCSWGQPPPRYTDIHNYPAYGGAPADAFRPPIYDERDSFPDRA